MRNYLKCFTYTSATRVSRRSLCLAGLGLLSAGTSLNIRHMVGASGRTAAPDNHLLLTRQNNHSTALAWSHDGGWIVSGGKTSPVEVWDASTGKTRVSLAARDGVLLDCSPDGRYVVTAGGIEVGDASSSAAGLPQTFSEVVIWDATSGTRLVTYNGMSYINAVAWSPDGTRIALAGSDADGATIHVCDALAGRLLLAYRQHVASRLAWSPDSRQIISSIDSIIGGVFTRTTRIWDSVTGRDAVVLNNSANALSWSPDGSLIACGDAEVITLRDARTGTATTSYKTNGDRAPILGVAWSPDGRFIACVGGSPQFPDPKGFVQIREQVTGQITSFHGHKVTVAALAWSPDSSRLASSSYDETIRIWHI
ncbi:WD40 repeat domain-containing protein [Dictyobacter aurantiacus]|uniref:WD40 repeat domain-containing protein n=1 Tax=Dictyobacter aurantiacus TaxID=1936993 RepID=UPI000F833B34|nr:PD40 domain-containing protein [Dictyobacter aurantiacus]